jgi:uncharacterized protein YcbK (DUF882 family)
MISRRTFIKGLAAIAAFVRAQGVFAAQAIERSLSLYNIHTDESLDIAYYANGSYDFEALAKIDRLMRCHYTNEVRPIDIRLLDLLCEITDKIGPGKRIDIISGYRSPEYNQRLRTLSRNVAKDSYHLKGLAIDLSISSIGNQRLASLARSFQAGGVGGYADFVHIDVGPVRSW